MKKVAIVEDNPDNLLLVSALLEGRFLLSQYADGYEALRGIAHEQPDLVLLDVSLPGIDGTEVLRRLRNDEKHSGLPVVALTAHAMFGDRENYLALGFTDYISKPIVDADELLNTIFRILKT